MPNKIRNLADRSITFSYLIIFLSALLIAATFRALLQCGALGEEYISNNVGYLEDFVMNNIDNAYVIAWLICLFVNTHWLYHAAENASAIDQDPERISPSWTIWWFAIPIANLWMPYKAVTQCWNSSLHGAGTLRDPAPWFINLWWIAWVLSEVLSKLSLRFLDLEDFDELVTALYIDLVTLPLFILAAGMWIFMIKQISAGQERQSSLVDVFD